MTPTKPVAIVLSLSVLAAVLWDTGSAQRSLPIGEKVTATQELQLHATPPRRIWPVSFVVWAAKPLPEKVSPGDSLTIREEKKIHDLWRTPSRWIRVEIDKPDGAKTQGWISAERDDWFQTGNGPAPGQGTNILPEDIALPSPPAAPAPN